MPFNRATRGWVYRLAKNEGGVIGFGSTYDLHHSGALIFVNHPFPVLEEERLPTPSLTLGEGYARFPFEGRSIVNISGMSFGAISAPAVRSLSRGAAVAGCWMDTGEGGLSPYHLEGGCDIIMQIGTAKYGMRDAQGNLSNDRLVELAKVVKAFEIKLSQGAKPGKGGVLLAKKGTAEIAQIRGIPEGRDSISPNRHRDISNMNELLEMVVRIRDLTGRPVGVKTAIGGWRFMNDLADAVTTVDGAETLVLEAGWAHSEGHSVKRLAPMAKLFATQTYRDVTAMAQQIFGGVGFTVEYDIQLYFRRAKQLQISWWNDRYLEELVAHQVLDDRKVATSRR
jgi:hypothetical protein